MTAPMTATDRHHIALHLAHRWFAYFEAPGGDLDAHLLIFHPRVRLSGRRGEHLFANDHSSLVTWFAAVPDAVSSHHIVHSSYAEASNGDGLLNMVIAYQAPSATGIHGSIISYETRIAFAPEGARFVALDKTPILPNTSARYETSWSTNRALALVHAELGGIVASDGRLRAALGTDVERISARAAAPEGSRRYDALVTGLTGLTGAGGAPRGMRAIRLAIADDGRTPLPRIERIDILDHIATSGRPGPQAPGAA